MVDAVGKMMGISGKVVVTFAALIVCCAAYPYEDVLLSGHKARVYDVEGYTPHIPVSSDDVLRKSSNTIYRKYPLAYYNDYNNLSDYPQMLKRDYIPEENAETHAGWNPNIASATGAPLAYLVPQHQSRFGFCPHQPHDPPQMIPLIEADAVTHSGRNPHALNLVFNPETGLIQQDNPPTRHPQMLNRGLVAEDDATSVPHIMSRYYEYIDELNSKYDD